MAIKIANTTVINDSRGLENITNLRTVFGNNLIGSGGDINISSTAVSAALGVTPFIDLRVNSIGVGTPASGNQGEIRATGDVTAYFSDDRLKNRLGSIENALNKLCSLDGFYYEANNVAEKLGYTKKREVGVSAQQMQLVLPEVIAPAPIDEQYLTVKYEKVLPLIIEAIKELRNEVNTLAQELKSR